VAEHDPTPEQRVAIVAPGSVAVRAGAGSGKTTVLAERWVRLVRPSDDENPPATDPSRVLAITFTDKAAGEMRIRIRRLVAREAARAPEAHQHWTRVQRELVGAQISTIHAFCARLVREHPLELDTDPDARVLDAEEARSYRERHLERLLLGYLRREHPGGLAALRRMRRLVGGPTGGAVGLVGTLLDGLARAGRTGEWLVRTTCAQLDGGRVRAEVSEAVRTLTVGLERALAEPQVRSRRRLEDAWHACRTWLTDDGPAAAGDLGAIYPRLDVLAQAMGQARLRAALGELLRRDGGRLRGRLPEAIGLAASRDETLALADLVAVLDTDLQAQKRRDGVLTFDDLIRFARTLIVDVPGVRDLVARRFDAILVD
jgi:ATP-dependent helicase/nuclease subunit A